MQKWRIYIVVAAKSLIGIFILGIGVAAFGEFQTSKEQESTELQIRETTTVSDEKKCVVILTAIFNEGGRDTEEFKEYSKRSNANGEAHGGVVLSTHMIEQNLGNGSTPHVVLVIEYPSRKIAIETFTCDEYKSILPLRAVAFKEVNILITKN